MFEQELSKLLEQFRQYEEMTDPFRYYQGTEYNPYVEMKKREHKGKIMRDVRLKHFLSLPQYRPTIDKLKQSLASEIQPSIEKEIEKTLNKVIYELNVGK